MDFDPNSMKKDLETVANFEGVSFGRLEDYWNAETSHITDMRYWNAGALMLIRAFQSLFLETVELVNNLFDSVPTQTELTFYTRFVPKLVQVFQQVCASELLATHGYPYPAYAMLRNTFDRLILISAAMQGITDFFKIEGIAPPYVSYDLKKAKKLRLTVEREVRSKMTGTASGLLDETVENIKIWDDLFDLEVHGSKLSLGMAMGWVQGKEPLHVYPKYQKHPAAIYTNRVCEIGWMAHRLLPLLQHSEMKFTETWREKWRILDKRFEDMIRYFADQSELKLGLTIIALVKVKFPFMESSLYPLEGQGMPVAD